MDINGIAFCGDSFCASVGPDESDWPYLMAQHFDAKVTCTGIFGVNFYHSVQSLFGLQSHYPVKEPLKETDLVIFAVSQPSRLINRDRLTMYYDWINGIANGERYVATGEPMDTGPAGDELIEKCTIARDFVDRVVDPQAQEVLQHAFIMFVDERMIAMKKKAIWLNSFVDSNRRIDGWCNQWKPKSGPIGNVTLADVSASEGEKVTAQDKRRNHFSPKTNKRLAAMLIDRIEKNELESGILDMKPWFNRTSGLESQFIYP